MSRELPERPRLEYLRKQAKELLRTMPQGKLADAQHTVANEYGFPTWAKLKSHVVTLGLNPAEALKVAVRDNDAQRVRELLESHRELRAKIDEPLPNYGFGGHACSQQCRGAIERRSMSCCMQAPTSKNEPTGGQAGSVCWMIATRAW